MKAFETTIKPLVKFGEGSSLCAGEKFKLLGCTKVLAGYDANINPAVVDAVIGSIEKEGIEVVRYACSYSDGKDDGVIECRQLTLDNKVDGFLAMGGGSTMDIVKAASLLVNVDLPEGAKSLVNYFVGHYNGPDLPRHAGLISIPTTAGTGAEATRSCIIASSALGVKATLSSQAAKADWVLLDPEMTKDLPPYFTAITGMDAIAHACEALCCTRSNIYTEMICGKSLELSWKNLPIVYKEPHNMEARANMSLAAYLALTGESYGNCGHSMAHAIGADFHAPPRPLLRLDRARCPLLHQERLRPRDPPHRPQLRPRRQVPHRGQGRRQRHEAARLEPRHQDPRRDGHQARGLHRLRTQGNGRPHPPVLPHAAHRGQGPRAARRGLRPEAVRVSCSRATRV